MRSLIASLVAAFVVMAGAQAVAFGNSTEALKTPTASPASIITGVPNKEIDGSRSSDKMELAGQDASPAVSADAAIKTAKMHQPDASVLQTVLIDYTHLVESSPSLRLVWVVNFDPSTARLVIFPPPILDLSSTQTL